MTKKEIQSKLETIFNRSILSILDYENKKNFVKNILEEKSFLFFTPILSQIQKKIRLISPFVKLIEINLENKDGKLFEIFPSHKEYKNFNIFDYKYINIKLKIKNKYSYFRINI